MNVDPLGGHSLRAGCMTQAAMNGVREFVIMKQTGHKTVPTLRLLRPSRRKRGATARPDLRNTVPVLDPPACGNPLNQLASGSMPA
jgi:hypothetical protein